MAKQEQTQKEKNTNPKAGKQRFSVITKTDLVEDFKNISYWARLKHTDAINIALAEFIGEWKKDPANKSYVIAGKIKPRPENADE